jgi:hypothetical protein
LIRSGGKPEAYDDGDTFSLPDGNLVLLHGLAVGRKKQVGDV